MIAAGGVLLYAAVKGKSVTGSIQALIKGKPPSTAPAANLIKGTSDTGTSGSQPATSGYSIATNIPAGKSSYDQQGLAQLWVSNGGPADTAAFAAAVAIAESSGSPGVTSSNPDGGTNVGLWQLDTNGVGSGYTVQELSDPNLNCQITIMATQGGTDWREWGDPVTAAVGYHYTPGSPVP